MNAQISDAFSQDLSPRRQKLGIFIHLHVHISDSFDSPLLTQLKLNW